MANFLKYFLVAMLLVALVAPQSGECGILKGKLLKLGKFGLLAGKKALLLKAPLIFKGKKLLKKAVLAKKVIAAPLLLKGAKLIKSKPIGASGYQAVPYPVQSFATQVVKPSLPVQTAVQLPVQQAVKGTKF